MNKEKKNSAGIWSAGTGSGSGVGALINLLEDLYIYLR